MWEREKKKPKKQGQSLSQDTILFLLFFPAYLKESAKILILVFNDFFIASNYRKKVRKKILNEKT